MSWSKSLGKKHPQRSKPKGGGKQTKCIRSRKRNQSLKGASGKKWHLVYFLGILGEFVLINGRKFQNSLWTFQVKRWTEVWGRADAQRTKAHRNIARISFSLSPTHLDSRSAVETDLLKRRGVHAAGWMATPPAPIEPSWNHENSWCLTGQMKFWDQKQRLLSGSQLAAEVGPSPRGWRWRKALVETAISRAPASFADRGTKRCRLKVWLEKSGW